MNDLKLLLILCSSGRTDDLRRLIDQHHVHGYTEIPELHGAGTTGRHLGTRAFPGTSSLLFTVLAADQADELVAALRELQGQCAPGEGIRVFGVDATELL